jgi:hypothetical protein
MADHEEERPELRAMELVICHYKQRGWELTKVAHAGGKHKGYDLLATKGSVELKLEVKGSAKLYNGIPDLYETEVDEHKRLRADFLCVGYFPPGKPVKLAIIPRDYFLPDCLNTKISYRIRSECKNGKAIEPFLIEETVT